MITVFSIPWLHVFFQCPEDEPIFNTSTWSYLNFTPKEVIQVAFEQFFFFLFIIPSSSQGASIDEILHLPPRLKMPDEQKSRGGLKF